MQIIKRNGSKAAFNPQKIQKRIKEQTKGLTVDADLLSIKVIGGVADNMTTSQLDELAAETAATMATNHPDYSMLAARIAMSSLHKETNVTFYTAMEKIGAQTSLLAPEFLQNVVNHALDYSAMIDHSRDFSFDYFGLKTLMKSYLLRIDGKIVERPQYMYMRVAVALWGDNLQEVKKTYDLLSQGYFTHATPTLFNAGLKDGQFASCFLLALPEDSIQGINTLFNQTSIISASAGGIGIHLHNLRAAGTAISGSGGTANGLKPMLKTMNEWSKYWDQGGGKRKGSFAFYLEPWHKDVHFLLEMRNNHGKEEERARDLFNAMWVPDLFMQRVEANAHWTLFCPNEVLKATGKALQDVYDSPTDKAFTTLYEECERLGIGKTIKAQDLWLAILKAQMETGTPYMVYKDAANSKSNQKNIGIIKSSNLCSEILEVSNIDEIAVCNLASLALPKFVKERVIYGVDLIEENAPVQAVKTGILEVDHDKLYEVVYQVTMNLNRVIDITSYPVPETKNSNLKHRPVGIGIQGLADLYILLRLPFDSEEAAQVNREVFETIYYAFLTASCDLARETDTPYSSFAGSPASQGILQFDMWGVTPSSRWNWSMLKADIKDWGLANSLGLAPMPTASTASILGNIEAFEPLSSNMYTRRVLAGEYVIVNKHLIKDLEELGLWNEGMKNKIILANGSVQTIPEIPQPIKDLYKTAYEISQKVLINQAADRGAFVCQGQSMNLFVAAPTIGKLTSMHFYAWKKGLKTGMYYLRSKPAAQAIQFTASKAPTAEEAIACSLDNPEGCEACGS